MASKIKNSQTKALFYCDGACSGNPGPGGWAAVAFDPNTQIVWQAYAHQPSTTNNRMELTATLRCLQWIESQKISSAVIHSDSKYVLEGIQKWRHGWKKNNWTKSNQEEVLNKDLWIALDKQLEALNPVSLEWVYVPGHSGIEGNEYVDQLAVEASLTPGLNQENTSPADTFTNLEIFSTSQPVGNSSQKSKKKNSSKALGYLALIDGKVHDFKTWPECEAQVKGKPYVKYKKYASEKDKADILTGWGQN